MIALSVKSFDESLLHSAMICSQMIALSVKSVNKSAQQCSASFSDALLDEALLFLTMICSRMLALSVKSFNESHKCSGSASFDDDLLTNACLVSEIF